MDDFAQNFDHHAACRAAAASISFAVSSAARFFAAARKSLSSKSLRTTEANTTAPPGFNVNCSRWPLASRPPPRGSA